MTTDASASDGVPPLVVAVLTYKRLPDIIELLPMLVEQLSTVDVAGRVVVVDNDPEAGAREAIASLQLTSLTYVHESRPGIAHARNAALDAASGAELLVFIDDDERPQPGWLAALVAAHRSTQATAVMGPVVLAPGKVGDPWIVAGGFLDRPRRPTGTTMRAAATANLLLDLRQVAALGAPRFEAAFGMTGGSDTMFTRRLVRAGGRIVACDEAVVLEYVRPERVTRAWVTQRAYRVGNSWSRTTLALETSVITRLWQRILLTATGGARVAYGLGREGLGKLRRNLTDQAQGRRMTARGAGVIAGAWGLAYNEYGTNAASRAGASR